MEEDYPILDIESEALRQRVGVSMGDRAEVERILSYFTRSVSKWPAFIIRLIVQSGTLTAELLSTARLLR